MKESFETIEICCEQEFDNLYNNNGRSISQFNNLI